ncbi:lytic transglycosylase [Aeromicrobium phragmitis]|uniref:Lytic transglycosylase n=1 Tax=Aeromicrobium phragmitis TaxID=2478914 RepID=A0A3L8PMH7_9ACTN|nr:transglycosylase SLT domain-containing protein [Aeromicrobium phragmitis]RLV56470.1 lytic transglycosylase [Aeromicrobium phragmitis]
MSLAAVTARIAEIRGDLAALSGPSATSGTQFAHALAAASVTATAPAPTPPTGPTGEDVVATAKQYLGVPYVWGGTDPDTGLDCSGLVQRVFADLGIDLPRLAGDQVLAGTPVASLADARPGDLLGFGGHPMKHVGIYLGNGQMIEAPRPGLAVRIGPVYETPTAIGRIIDAPAVNPMSARSVDGATPYAALFQEAGNRYGVEPRLLAAVARAESAFDPRAVSHAGAQGLMQLMPATARGLGVSDPFDPAQAVDGAARLLRDLQRQFGTTELALAAYNAGPGAVQRYGGVPPYRETQNYVATIMRELR